MDRRRFLYGSSSLALYTAMGGGLRAAENRRRPKIKRFIFVNLRGAPSQMETFDAKPNHRNGGPTQGIETQIPGLYFSQHFEGLAEYSNQMSLVHTTSRIGAHQLGQHYVSTGGFLPNPAQQYPGLSALAGWGLPREESALPRVVSIGRAQSAGFLGNQFNPYSVKAGQNDFKLSDELTARLQRAESMRDEYVQQSPTKNINEYQEEYRHGAKATQLSLGFSNRAFDLDNESQATRDAYGGGIGNSLLLARRLAQADIPSIEMSYGGWDTHTNNFGRCQNLCEPLNKGLCQMIKELKALDLFDSTLIMVAGEFGRTPVINANDGRDHYPNNTPVLLIGGRMQGTRYGESSPDGTQIKDGVSMGELGYSICRLLGMNPNEPFMHKSGRPLNYSPSKTGLASLYK